jgi:hypothetical protein
MEHLYDALPLWASRHRSVMHSSILLMSRRAYRLDIFLVVIGRVSYLILVQQDHLEVCYKYLCYYNRHSSGTVHCESHCWFMQF